jgi:hypothetical protein
LILLFSKSFLCLFPFFPHYISHRPDVLFGFLISLFGLEVIKFLEGIGSEGILLLLLEEISIESTISAFPQRGQLRELF